MASRSSIAALLRRCSAASRLPASREREFLPSSASAPFSSGTVAATVPAASSPATRASPARSVLKVLVRERGEEMAQSATGGPVRGYHALPASASSEALPALRGSRATFSSSSAATAGSYKYDPVSTARSVEAEFYDIEERLELCSHHIKVARFILIGLFGWIGVWYFKAYQIYQDLKALKRDVDKLRQDVEALERAVDEQEKELMVYK